MENVNRYQWHIFGLFCTVIAMVLTFRLMVLSPLFLEAELRTKASAIIQATAAREGWLTSGVTIRRISDDGTRVLYRSYYRGPDTVQCYNLSFIDGSLSSCK